MSGLTTSDTGQFVGDSGGAVLIVSGADTGSQADVVNRLQRWLPTQWFPTSIGTRIYATLCGAAAVLSAVYAQLSYVAMQTRIATATDGWLDLISLNYFGNNLPRLPVETDPAFSLRIRANLFVPRATRPALSQALQKLTGNTPTIVYPWHPGDVGAYGYGSLGYGAGTGCWGSLQMPAQSFVTVALPADGIHTAAAADVYNTIQQTIPLGSEVWVNVEA